MASWVSRYRQAPPRLKWWGNTWIRENNRGDQERIIVLRLPSYGMGYDINRDEERWGQRLLIWNGRKGFQQGWHFSG